MANRAVTAAFMLLSWSSLAGCAGTLRTVSRQAVFTIGPRSPATVTLDSTARDPDVLCDAHRRLCARGTSEAIHGSLSILLAYQSPRFGRGIYSARFGTDGVTIRDGDAPALTLWWRFEMRERTRGLVLAIADRSTVSVSRDADRLKPSGLQRLVDSVLARVRTGIRDLDIAGGEDRSDVGLAR